MSTGGTQNVGGISAALEIDLASFDAQMQAAGQKLDEVRAKLQALDQAMRAGTVGPQAYAKALADLQAEEQAVIAQAGQLQAALGRAASSTTNVGAASVRLGTSASKAGYGLQLMGQALDDLQYGFSAVQNNIPGIVAAFGGGAGLAGAVGIVAVGVNQLIIHWHDLTQALELSGTESETDRLLKLAGATREAAAEAEKAAKAKALQNQVEGMATSLSPEQRKTKGAVEDVLSGPTYQATLKGLVEARKAAGTFAPMEAIDTTSMQAINQQLTQDPTNQYWQMKRQQILDKYEQAGIQRAKEDLAKAATDPEALKRLMATVSQQPTAFPAGLGEKLQAATPEGIQAGKDAEKAKKAFEEEVQQRAQQMAKGELGTTALSQNTVTEADVRQRLGQAGLTPEQVETQAGPVFAKFGQLMGEELRGRAAGRNISPEAARMELLSERIDKASKDGAGGGRSVEDTQLRDQQRAFDQEVKQRARQLSEGELGTTALSQAPVSEADVRRRLSGAGLTPEQVEKEAGPVFQGFAQMMRDQVQGKAIAGGFGVDRARAELLSERIAKANDDPEKRRKTEDPGDLMRKLLRLRLDAQPEARSMEFVAPAEMAARVQMAANQGPDQQLRAMLDVAENTAEQVKILEKIQGGVPAVAT